MPTCAGSNRKKITTAIAHKTAPPTTKGVFMPGNPATPMSEPLAMVSYLIEARTHPNYEHQKQGENKAQRAKYDACYRHPRARVALRITSNLVKSDDREDQAGDTERKAIATTQPDCQ